MFTIDDLFEIAIKMEKNGEAVYADSVPLIRQDKLKDLLSWMANEEASHQCWFREQKEKIALSVNEANLKKILPDVLQQMMGDHTLSLDEIDFENIENIVELLETFIGFEEETIQFYEMLGMFIEDDSVLTGVETIIAEEKKHVAKLRRMIDDL